MRKSIPNPTPLIRIASHPGRDCGIGNVAMQDLTPKPPMAHLRPIHDEKSYVRMTALMNSLLDVAGDDEDHPLSSLLELVNDMVAKYEQEHYAIEPAEPKDALRFLIEARGMKQEDLSAVVPQSNLSAILAGKRKISATLAGKLGKFFGVSAALFVPQ